MFSSQGLSNQLVFDSQRIENALGWRISRLREEEIAAVISESAERDIIKRKDGRLAYVLKRIPVLGAEEAELARQALDHFRGQRKKTGAKEALEDYIRDNRLELGKLQKGRILCVVSRLASQNGVVGELLEHDCLEEIAVIGLGKAKPVHVFDRAFGWLPTNLHFSSSSELHNIANAIAAKSGRRITMRTPAINAFLSDGSRLNAIMEPASVSGPCLTIRKFRKSPFTPAELALNGSASFTQMAFLWMAMQSDCSILVCGNTGSGKTTLLNSLFCFVPMEERVVIVEETPEIRVPHRHAVKIATAEGIGIGMAELATNTLRMRPDRIIIGEIRNKEETCAFMDTLLAGQGKGSYTTFHAQSSEDAIGRLKNLGAAESDLGTIDLIAVQNRWTSFDKGKPHEERKLSDISEISLCNGRATANKIFWHDFKQKKFMQKKCAGLIGCGKVSEKICRTFGISEKEAAKDIMRRKKFLENNARLPLEVLFNAISDYGKGS